MPQAIANLMIVLLIANLIQTVSNFLLIHTGYFKVIARLSVLVSLAATLATAIAIVAGADLTGFIKAFTAVYVVERAVLSRRSPCAARCERRRELRKPARFARLNGPLATRGSITISGCITGATMAKTPLSLKSKDPSAVPAEPADAEVVFEPQSQKRRPEAGRYRLQVDRQTKATYTTFEAAEAQGMIIKKQFKQVQVAIYDIQASSNTILELPA